MTNPPPDPSFDRALPSNLEAERSVLGAILIHNACYESIGATLKPEHFYRDAHKRIYKAMQRVIDEKKIDCDFVTLKNELNRSGELDEVGGPAYIAALTDGLPHSSNVAHYSEIVREKAMLRGIIQASSKLLTAAYDAEQSPAEILKTADRMFLDLEVHVDRRGFQSMRASAMELFDDLEQRVDTLRSRPYISPSRRQRDSFYQVERIFDRPALFERRAVFGVDQRHDDKPLRTG